jgi:hypothetical protein
MGPRKVRSGRAKMKSPGRPPVLHRSGRRPFWEAIANGRSSEEAAHMAGGSQAVGTGWFRECGGMPPSHLPPSTPPPTGRYLSLNEREQIALLRAQHQGVREIARQLARSPRRCRVNCDPLRLPRAGLRVSSDYGAVACRSCGRTSQACQIGGRSCATALCPRTTGGEDCHSSGRHGRRQHRRWSRAWSPEQIAHRLPIDFPDDTSMRISHEAIYQALYIQGRGALRRELTACLRTGRALRVPREKTRGRGKSFVTPEILN